ncbi:DUF433 domain-containing protein [Nocardia cyriacigeorgica]|uniref:DUF433 domain-containing protein n=1 Tax=Nocardia cyriacigeorgica TaxID=135487 RepID=UPI0013CFD70A|nr:DUF433 domain-containing protein [Nocardia cyriacigeorgica]NEW28519.1 DUF433 domain-containing protein [Nocardia cyriacigeorgica]
MSFPSDITSALSGATLSQLRSWRAGASPLLAPEYGVKPKALYSFRDVVALRTVVRLRSQVSLQKVRKAFRSMKDMDLTEHPSRYTLVADSSSVFLVDNEGATDLVKNPKQRVLIDLYDVFAPFTNFRDEEVVDFLHPRKSLEVREARVGGWPTIADTRVPFDTVALLVADGDVPPEDVEMYFPGVDQNAVADAVSFHDQIARIGRSA